MDEFRRFLAQLVLRRDTHLYARAVFERELAKLEMHFIGVIAGVGWGMLIFGERPTAWVIGSLGLLVLALTLTISFRRDQKAAHGQ